MDLQTIILFIFAVIFTFAGLAGLILPLLPGPLLIFIGLFLVAWAEDFVYVGWKTLLLLAFIMIVAHAVDLFASAIGAKRYGAGRKALFGAIIGTFVGLFFGVLGIIIGPFVGAVIGQLFEHKDIQSAGLIGIGTWIGFLIGMAAKIAFGMSMIGIFILVRYIF
jgi:uncharacterized protein YqgC (DUF456 family)